MNTKGWEEVIKGRDWAALFGTFICQAKVTNIDSGLTLTAGLSFLVLFLEKGYNFRL